MLVTPTPAAYGRNNPRRPGRRPAMFRGRGFAWKRPDLPCLERSRHTENVQFFGERPIPSTGSGGSIL